METPGWSFRRILDQPVSLMSGELIAYDFGFIHQSNGQIQELSRSWNRFFYRFMYIIDRLLIKTTLWYRVPEKTEDDENSREYNFLGYGEVEVNYKYQAQKYQLRIIPGLKKQGFELSVSSPWKEGLRFYTKIGHGYGLSLLDYDHDNRKIGVGFILADPFSY